MRNRGKNTRKYRKSGGENPVSKIEKTPDNVKYRITNFYRYITMYILYLTNVIELYSNIPKNNSSYPTSLIDIIAIDRLNKKKRFTIIYNLLSLSFNTRIFIKVKFLEVSNIMSITNIFSGSN